MGNYTSGANTVCPYYLRESNKSITCEGLIEGTCTMHRFPSRLDKQAYQANHCERFVYGQVCPAAAAILLKNTEYGNSIHEIYGIFFPSMSLGQRIAMARRQLDMTQKQLARKVPLSVSYISNLECDRYMPSVDTLMELARALLIDVKMLLEERKR